MDKCDITLVIDEYQIRYSKYMMNRMSCALDADDEEFYREVMHKVVNQLDYTVNHKEKL